MGPHLLARGRQAEGGGERPPGVSQGAAQKVYGCGFAQRYGLLGDGQVNHRPRLVISFLAALLPATALAQGLGPARLLKPGDSWPSYNGDYSGRRFSPLTQINS